MSGQGFSDGYLSDVVDQATGMISAQIDCDMIEALGRLRIRADATGQTVEQTALDVLDHVIRFDDS